MSLAAATNLWIMAGWTDGTKLEIFELRDDPAVHVAQWASFNSRNGDDVARNTPPLPVIWLGLRDDGLSVYWELSVDGVNFTTVYTTTKLLGYLSAYSSIFFGVRASGGEPWTVTLRCYDVNGLTAVFPPA
jgi:hypothetical protein